MKVENVEVVENVDMVEDVDIVEVVDTVEEEGGNVLGVVVDVGGGVTEVGGVVVEGRGVVDEVGGVVEGGGGTLVEVEPTRIQSEERAEEASGPCLAAMETVQRVIQKYDIITHFYRSELSDIYY